MIPFIPDLGNVTMFGRGPEESVNIGFIGVFDQLPSVGVRLNTITRGNNVSKFAELLSDRIVDLLIFQFNL